MTSEPQSQSPVSGIDMRMFARNMGVTLSFPVGGILFRESDIGDCLYIVQSGIVEMVIHEQIIDTCGPNQALGFMSVIDGAPRTATARVREAAEVSVIDQRKFRFMIDEIPNFAKYIMDAMAHRIRGMGDVIGH